uniref:DUF4283 domain-containing protein n=1 Tax=Cannabis sativa TaxID=3483 RepID=A0A803Q7T1_CANSA
MGHSVHSSPHHLALNDEEALVRDFDGVSLGSNVMEDSCCLVVKILTQKSLKPDWLDKAMREAWTLRFPINFTKSPHLAQFVAKYIGDLIEIHKTTLLEISGPFLRICVLLDITKPIRRGHVDVQPRIDIPVTTSPISTSAENSVVSSTMVSSFQSLLCVVSQVMLSEAPTIVHTDKGKGVQLLIVSVPIAHVPVFPPRPLTIGGSSGTKRSYTRQEVSSGTSVRSILKRARASDNEVVVPNDDEDQVVPAGVAEQPCPEK